VLLPPGSVLALYTDGLIEVRGSDLGSGIAALCRAVADGPQGLEELADAVMATVPGSDDDVALLLLRVPEDVDARSRTASVPVPLSTRRCRRSATHSRRRCGPGRSPTTSSTPARCSRPSWPPTRWCTASEAWSCGCGLSRDHLLLESLDGGHHMPRRRRAEEDDEGGRGLQLVAALAHRWGFRPSDDGKVVWVEFDLCGE
jgi:hypothetical protein